MTAVLREAWLWLLLAFVLGLVIGYFLRRYTVGDDPVDTDAEPATGASSPSAASEDDEAPAAAASTSVQESQAAAPSEPTKDVDVDVLETAAVTLAELSRSAPSPAEARDEQAEPGPEPAPESETPVPEESDAARRERWHLDDHAGEEEVDTHNVYMPVVEPLRVPHGRREAASISASSPQDVDLPAEVEVEPADAAAVIDEASAEAAVQKAERGKPKRRTRRTS